MALGRVGIQLQSHLEQLGWPVPLKLKQKMRYFNTEVGIREHLFKTIRGPLGGLESPGPDTKYAEYISRYSLRLVT